MNYAIAVIDIGMTNKKAAVYDISLRQLDAKYRTFAPKMVNGLETHDLSAMEDWFIETLREFAAKYPVKAVAVSTHGATFVCLKKDGSPVPCVYYTHEPGADFHKRFYQRFGNPEELQMTTGTPPFGAMINPAKNIMFVQEQFPGECKNVESVLGYPQYWGFRFTGNKGTESTYLGNHNYFWNFIDGGFSTVARDLGIASLLPGKIRLPWDVLGTVSDEFARKTGLAGDTIVTMGIHDSNSSLLPHLAKKTGEFILNSTGTWCVVMNPVEKYGYEKGDLGKVVFFNLSAFRKPVKTAIFIGGQEFEIWSKCIMASSGENAGKSGNIPGWNESLYRSILKEKKLFLMPELTPGSGQFPSSRARVEEDGQTYFFETIAENPPPCFNDCEKSFAALRISLVMQTLTALERAGLKDGCRVYTEGGFRKDESYNRLLASALRNNKVFLTGIAEATALGAAMTARMALTGETLDALAGDFEIEYTEQEKNAFPELEAYRAEWLSRAE